MESDDVLELLVEGLGDGPVEVLVRLVRADLARFVQIVRGRRRRRAPLRQQLQAVVAPQDGIVILATAAAAINLRGSH